jgi:hypothetical protein
MTVGNSDVLRHDSSSVSLVTLCDVPGSYSMWTSKAVVATKWTMEELQFYSRQEHPYGSGTHPASCSVATGGSLPGDKAATA